MQKTFLSKEQKKSHVFINSTTPGGKISKYGETRFNGFACDSQVLVEEHYGRYSTVICSLGVKIKKNNSV